jgi:hypothetical protein
LEVILVWAIVELRYSGLKRLYFTDEDEFEDFLNSVGVLWGRKEETE